MSVEWQRSQSLETCTIAITTYLNRYVLFLFTAILTVFRSRLQLFDVLHEVVLTAMTSQDERNAAFRAVFIPECEMRGIPIQAANKMADQMERQAELECSQTVPELAQDTMEVHARRYVRNSELDYVFFFVFCRKNVSDNMLRLKCRSLKSKSLRA